MIAKQFRFHRRSHIKAVVQNGKTSRAKGLSLKYLRMKSNEPGFKAAVVVSKKVHKSAVVRNRIRRRLFERIRLREDLCEGWSLVIFVYEDSIATIEAEELNRRVDGLLGILAGS